MKLFRWVRSRQSMDCLSHYFTDAVAGRAVYLWVDCYGDLYLAMEKFGFRVKVEEVEPQETVIESLLNQARKAGIDITTLPVKNPSIGSDGDLDRFIYPEEDQGMDELDSQTTKKDAPVLYLYGTEKAPQVQALEYAGKVFEYNIYLN